MSVSVRRVRSQDQVLLRGEGYPAVRRRLRKGTGRTERQDRTDQEELNWCNRFYISLAAAVVRVSRTDSGSRIWGQEGLMDFLVEKSVTVREIELLRFFCKHDNGKIAVLFSSIRADFPGRSCRGAARKEMFSGLQPGR